MQSNYNLASAIYQHSLTSPQATAVVCQGRTLNYGELAERAARLAACDGLCVTASALVNRTLGGLLAAARPDAWKLLVGPSAPLCREALDLGFAAVCGARVADVSAVVRVIQEGGCFQQIRRTGGVRLLNLEA